jgi:tRNA(Ile2) C34 agmatinyltransferase TiaS
MTILSKARSDYKCKSCKLWIRKDQKYLNKPEYQFGASKYCIDCVRKELDND